MAHPANRSIDFAPAWLKLPDQSQEQKRSKLHITRPSHPNKGVNHSLNPSQSHHSNQAHSIHLYNNQQQQPAQAGHPHQHYNQSQHHLQSSAGRSTRTAFNSFNGRSVASSHPNQQLHRSQSTGSYSVNGTRQALSSTSSATDPLEEEFPSLGSAPAIAASQHHVNNTGAQWRKKVSGGDQQDREEANGKPGHTNDKLLPMSGKVYRAQVRGNKRSNMIPIVNGRGSHHDNHDKLCGENGDYATIRTTLSSSVEKEKRLLQEMGWKEDDDSDDEGDPSMPQDPKQLQEIFMKAKEAREKLLLKSKQSMKVAPTLSAVLPNEDELPSSSDNSDAE